MLEESVGDDIVGVKFLPQNTRQVPQKDKSASVKKHEIVNMINETTKDEKIKRWKDENVSFLFCVLTKLNLHVYFNIPLILSIQEFSCCFHAN